MNKLLKMLELVNASVDRLYSTVISLAESLAKTGIKLMYFMLLYKLAVGDLLKDILEVFK